MAKTKKPENPAKESRFHRKPFSPTKQLASNRFLVISWLRAVNGCSAIKRWPFVFIDNRQPVTGRSTPINAVGETILLILTIELTIREKPLGLPVELR